MPRPAKCEMTALPGPAPVKMVPTGKNASTGKGVATGAKGVGHAAKATGGAQSRSLSCGSCGKVSHIIESELLYCT